MRLALCAIAILCACARGGANAQLDGHGDVGSGSGKMDAAGDGQMIDASNGCAVQPCSIVPQCGCTDPSKSACDLGSGSSNACRFATVSGVEGQSCISSQGCAPQYTCVGGGGNFSCEKYCGTTADCISPRGQCVIQLTDGTNPIPGAVVCSSNCDPSTATNALCPTGWTCDLFTATYMATTNNIADCRVNGPAGLNAACSTTNQCQAGLSCVNTGTDVCKKLCNKTANTGCTSGTCTSFTTAVKIPAGTGTEYGVCL